MQDFRAPQGMSGQPEDFQTAAQRGKATGGRFYAAMKPDGSPGPARVVMQSEATIAWRATFEPFRRELPRAYSWLEFIHPDLPPDDKQIVKKMVEADTRDGILSGLIPDAYSRKLVIGNANFGLVMGSRLGAAVSLDSMHRRALVARVMRGEANPAFGSHALSINFPAVDAMTWEDVNDARKVKGLPGLRGLLAEIEAAVWAEAENERQLEVSIAEAYRIRLQEAAEKLAPSLKGTASGLAISAVVSLVTGPLALPVGLAAGAAVDIAGEAVRHYQYQRSWLSAANQLTRRRPSR